MPDNNKQQQQNNPQDKPGTTGGGSQGQGSSQGSSQGTGTGTAKSPGFDDSKDAGRGQKGEGGMKQEGAWRPTDDDSTKENDSESAGGKRIA